MVDNDFKNKQLSQRSEALLTIVTIVKIIENQIL